MHTPILIIGAGPGGYPAAFYAADLGLKVTLVDTEPNPGGVCLYRGCIPSKALLHAAKILTEAREAKEIGITFEEPQIDLDQLRAWKNSVVTKLTGGLGQLRKQREIQYIQGRAVFLNSNEVEITQADGQKQTLRFDKAIVATGSRAIRLPHAPESPRVMDSTDALKLENIPESLLLVGGGYIGLELGSAYAAFGSRVAVVEMLDRLLPGADADLVSILEKRLKKTFTDIKTRTKVTQMEDTGRGVRVTFEDDRNNQSTEEFEKVLVAIGRRPNSQGIGLENTRVTLDDKGFIIVNAQRQTTDPSIYAIGDVAGGLMLAHKATHEAHVAVEAIAGQKTAFEPNAIPAVVFTDPEIAWCGLTETEAKAQGREVVVTKFPWGASGRAIALNRPEGLTKVIFDPATERVLGVAMAGPGAGEMIAEGVLSIEMGTVAKDLKLSIHPHPTISETVMECAEAFLGQSTHIYRKKR